MEIPPEPAACCTAPHALGRGWRAEEGYSSLDPLCKTLPRSCCICTCLAETTSLPCPENSKGTGCGRVMLCYEGQRSHWAATHRYHISTSNTSIFLATFFYQTKWLFTSFSPLSFSDWYETNNNSLQKASNTAKHPCPFSQLGLRQRVCSQQKRQHNSIKQNVNLQHISNSAAFPYMCFYPTGNIISFHFCLGLEDESLAFLYICSFSKRVQKGYCGRADRTNPHPSFYYHDSFIS